MTRLHHIALTLAILGGTAVAAPTAAAQAGRVAIIDSRVVLLSMPAHTRAEAEFTRELTRARELVHTATEQLKAAVEELARHEEDLRPQQRQAAMMLLRARELTLEDMVAQLNLLADKRQAELQAPLQAQIREAVRTVRRRDRFAVVLDIANADSIVDADEAINITDRVIAELQRSTTAKP